MKVEKVAHFHIVVKNIEAAARFFSDLLGINFVGPIKGVTPVKCAFDDRLGLELQEPTSAKGYIADFLEKYGEGIVTMGLKVPDIDEAIAELEAKGINILVKGGKDEIKFAVTDPEDTFGVGLELLQYQSVQDAPCALLGKVSELPWMRF